MPEIEPWDDDTGVQWTNWAGNVSSVPSTIAHPSSVSDVQSLIRNQQGGTIRAVGTGHSFSPLVVANGQTIVDLSAFVEGGQKAWRWQHQGLNLVSFLPSARWADVREALTTSSNSLPPMYLSTTGPLDSINATGFVAAGCHGTGWQQPTVSDLIWGIEFIDASGKLQVFTEETTPGEMNLVRVNLGTLGIITKVTLHVEPMYRLLDEEVIVATETIMGPNPIKTDGVIDTRNLHQLLTGNDYIELFWFPGSGFDGEIWVKKFNRTTEEIRDVPLRPDGWVDQYADKIMSTVAEHPLLLGPVLSAAWSTIKSRAADIQKTQGFVSNAPRVLFYTDRAFPVLDLEVAFPIPASGANSWDLTNVVQAWYAALNYAYAHRDQFPVSCCLHARFTRNSQAVLSPAYSTKPDDRCCWMEFLSAYPKFDPNSDNRNSAMVPYLQMVNEIMPTWIGKMAGRPHWAKNWQYITPHVDMRSLYPASNFQAFDSLRKSFDPKGMFLNDFLRNRGVFSN